MSKTKKLTTEEQLEEALISEEEQSFNIPENWVWTKMGALTQVVGGGTPKSKVKEYYENGSIPWLTPADLSGYQDIYIERGKRNITDLGLSKSSAKMLPAKTVLLSSRAPIGYVAIASNELSTNQGFKSFIPSKAYHPEYLYWYMKFSKGYLESISSGSTFKELSGSKCKEISFPMPPMEEQKRIADKVKRLLNKIDEAKELIEEAKESFELRRAAILDKAFHGELTSTWRIENNHEYKALQSEYSKIDELLERFPKKKNIDNFPESWKLTDINEVCSESFYGPRFSKGDYSTDGGVPTVRTTDMTKDGGIELNNPPYVKVSGERLEAFKVLKGDLLVTRTGSIGTMAVFNGAYEAIPSAYLIRFRFKENINPRFIFYYLKSPIGQQMLGLGATAITQPNINAKTIKSIPIFIPSLSEQEKIVEILDGYFHKEKQISELLERDETINQLRSSLLNKAFRGELGTNDPTEESAIELLKEVLQEN
ncbi:restriction endonuclease subunit S [Texcoconibacillus texcoconensis]|uniref:Type I restriction enzyme S subunit n=1 Tax=Texcoconibacillus texcoconensis TaxID=1095777 RepID=A0A840QIW2_9BACI|nr:restriction endonuclease subunit S [Texcoconibacillus texcoconensis]MBB5171918.1 type I restriction enzyme S subunit [Texcoconibacillus texcoconensis]